MKTLKFISDPCHGWLEVPLSELFRTAIYKHVSGYSYFSKTHAYLEEDLDAKLYLDATGSNATERIEVRSFPEDYCKGIKRIDGIPDLAQASI